MTPKLGRTRVQLIGTREAAHPIQRLVVRANAVRRLSFSWGAHGYNIGLFIRAARVSEPERTLA